MRANDCDFTNKLSTTYEGKTVKIIADEKRPCMVLMDGGSGLPIFGISVNSSSGGRSLMTRRTNELFQSIFENDKQPINFRVTNFTEFRISFSITRDKKCINKINLLRPASTTEIKSDYSNGEREMFLDVLDEKVSVAQDEQRPNGEAAKGTYFSINVSVFF